MSDETEVVENTEEEITEEQLNQILDLAAIAAEPKPWDSNTFVYFGPETRSIYFHLEVDEMSAATLISQILELSKQDEEQGIFLYINTPGGDANQGMAIYDIIKSVATPVIGIAVGECSSAGLTILAACDYRVAFPSTRFFFHEPQMHTSHIGSSVMISRIIKEYDHWRATQEKVLIDVVGLVNWCQYFKDEFYFSAKEALEFGLIARIVSPKEKHPLPSEWLE